MYILITFDLDEKDYKNGNKEKIYNILETKFNFKKYWDNNKLPNNTMIGEFKNVLTYMQIYSNIKNELKSKKLIVKKLNIFEIVAKHVFVSGN